MKKLHRLAVTAVVFCLCGPLHAGGPVLYAGASDGGDAEIGTLNQANAAFSVIGFSPNSGGDGNPPQVPAMACDNAERLFISENTTPPKPLVPIGTGNRCGRLFEISPTDASSITDYGYIRVNGSENTCVRISDFDFHPTTGVLYGVGRGSEIQQPGLEGKKTDTLYTISLSTPPVATAVGVLGGGTLSRGGLAFRSDGDLFLFSKDGDLAQISLADASAIGAVQALSDCVDGASFRSSDDVPYATECDNSGIFTVDVSNAMSTPIGDTEPDVASLAFCGEGGTGVTPTPTPTLPTTPPTPTPTSTATPFPTLPPPPPPPGENDLYEVPTLSVQGLMTLVLLLVVTAGVILRRRF